MEHKICEICGKEKPEDQFSKSYKKRCKECVATRQRIDREMKNIKLDSYYKDDEYKKLLEQQNTTIEENLLIDWEQRRYETAKDISCAYMISHPTIPFIDIAKISVEFADMILNKLKERNHDEQDIQDP